jgi:hypothetical protein
VVLPGFPWVADRFWSSPEGSHEGRCPVSRILGLSEPWLVEAIELNTGEGRVDIRVEHGVIQVNLPWAESKGCFTLLMARLIIDVLTERVTLTGAPHHSHFLGRGLEHYGEGRAPGSGTQQSKPAR